MILSAVSAVRSVGAGKYGGAAEAMAAALLALACVSTVEAAPASSSIAKPGELWDSADTDWVNWVVVNVCPTRIYSKEWRSDALRAKLFEDFDPDVADWWSGPLLNSGDFLTMRGVASNSPTAYEYQEAIGPMWGYALRLFRENGAALRENGSWARFPKTKYGGAHMMCLNAPKWRGVVAQGFLRAAALGDAVTQDNIGCPVSKYHPGFCVRCNRRFVEYLEGRFSAGELRGMGVGDVETFQLRSYLSAKRKATGLPFWKPPNEGADPEALITDPVIHEYIRFQNKAMLRAWIDLATAAKREAVRVGRPVPALYGNQAGVAGQTPLATALCNHVDVVWIESSRHFQPCFEQVEPASAKPQYREGVFVEAAKSTLPRQAWSTLMYKVGRAAGHFRRPVWTMQYPEQWYGADKRMPAAVTFAEAHANGGVPVLLFGPSVTKQADTEGVMWQVNRTLAEFVGRHRALFTDRTSVAEVALVLSLPSLFWRNCSSLRVQPTEHLERFTTTARELEERHVPYDVLVLGHPDLYDDAPSLARLGRYRQAVLPAADCLSGRQAEALRSFADDGGRVALIGECGTRDEELRRRTEPALAGLSSDQRVDLSALTSEAIVRTDLPSSVWLNVWRHGRGPMVSVQMVNYDLALEADRPRPTKPSRLTIDRRQAQRVSRAWLVTPESGVTPLDLETHGDWLEVTVPPIEVWAIVAFAAEGEWEARSAAAEARKWLERLKIATRCRGVDDHREFVERVSALLGRIQGEAEVDDFASLNEPLTRLSGKLRQQVTSVTDQVTATQQATQKEALPLQAVRKFDFGEADVADGWLPVRRDSEYTAARGYGWTSTGQMTAVDDVRPDALHRDYLHNRDPAEYLDYRTKGEGNRQFKVDDPPLNPAEFRVDVPNGEYVVTVITGAHEPPGVGSAAGEGGVAMTYVSSHGVPVALGKPIRAGSFEHRVFRVRVTDGRLLLEFSGSNVGPFYHNTIEWLVNGLVIQRPDQELTELTAKALAETDLVNAAGLRDWSVLGPFADPDCTGLDTAFGPEREGSTPRVDAGEDGPPAWRPTRAAPGGLPAIDLGALLGETNEVIGFARTHVRCPEATDAVLWLSTSKTAVAYVSGHEVVRDTTATGLLPDELRAGVRLQQGWNTILLKCASHWSGPWSFWAGFTTPEGSPLRGIEVSSTGGSQRQE